MIPRCANSRKARKEQLRRMRGLRPEADHTAVKWFAAISVALIVIGMAWAALAHGPAKWIADGGYKNAAGELCCGERDCGYRISGTIKAGVDGYRVNAEFLIGHGPAAKIQHVEEFVPYSDATPSPDGEFWRCDWGGQRKCFFAPPGST